MALKVHHGLVPACLYNLISHCLFSIHHVVQTNWATCPSSKMPHDVLPLFTPFSELECSLLLSPVHASGVSPSDCLQEGIPDLSVICLSVQLSPLYLSMQYSRFLLSSVDDSRTCCWVVRCEMWTPSGTQPPLPPFMSDSVPLKELPAGLSLDLTFLKSVLRTFSDVKSQS